MSLRADAVLFDKDGTLFDFGATWDGWGLRAIAHFAGGNADLRAALAAATGFDLATGRFVPESPVVAGTSQEAAACFASVLPNHAAGEIAAFLEREAERATLVETVPLTPFLAALQDMGLTLGVMTNDTEAAARAHLREAGVEQRFRFIAGFDSGYGAKPEPGPLRAFAETAGIAPERVVMVGDSPHDLVAGRAAGMQTVAVLTGPIGQDRLAPLADAVLPDIGHLLGWLTPDHAEKTF